MAGEAKRFFKCEVVPQRWLEHGDDDFDGEYFPDDDRASHFGYGVTEEAARRAARGISADLLDEGEIFESADWSQRVLARCTGCMGASEDLQPWPNLFGSDRDSALLCPKCLAMSTAPCGCPVVVSADCGCDDHVDEPRDLHAEVGEHPAGLPGGGRL